MSRIPFVCGGMPFKTQKALKEYINNIKKNIGECDSIKNDYPEEYEFLTEAMKRHPEYTEKTKYMIDLKLNQNMKNTGMEFTIINSKNAKNVFTSISFLTIVSGKATNNETEFSTALRRVIESQIDLFRNEKCKFGKLKCELCYSNKDIQIDHHNIYFTFKSLVDNFIKEFNIPIPHIFDKDTDGSNVTILTKEDEWIGTDFYNYHEKNAVLRILCRKCNLQSSNK